MQTQFFDPTAPQIVTLTPKMLQAMLVEAAEQGATNALEHVKGFEQDYPQGEIMDMLDIADSRTFEKLRAARGAKPTRTVRGVKMYVISSFKKTA